jgi:hypothetical protein
MNNYSIEGIGNINGGQFMELRVEGVGTNKGDIKADRIAVEGVFKSTGYLEANLFDCEGVCDIYGNIRVKKINIEGVINMKNNQKMEAEMLYCEGYLTSGGDLYVDSLKATGCIKVKGIYGDNIDINSFGKTINQFKKIFVINILKKSCLSKVTTIEATTICLSGVNADTINGHDIIIGPGCVINTIDCTGTLKIHESSKVEHILGAKAVEE